MGCTHIKGSFYIETHHCLYKLEAAHICRMSICRISLSQCGGEEEINANETLVENCQDITDRFKIHFKVIRLFSVLLMLGITVTLVGVFAFISSTTKSEPIDCNMKIVAVSAENRTSCAEFHRFPLTEELYVIVCSIRDDISIEINQYEHGEPGPSAVQLNKQQWLYLKRSTGHIDRSLVELEEVHRSLQ